MSRHAQAKPRTNAKDARTNAAPTSAERALDKPSTRLPADLIDEAQSRLGFDASNVRVHADAESGASAREMRMRAYAVRPHIVFAPGMYRPNSTQGRALALHELGHIKQQAEFVPGNPLAISRSAAHEANANQLRSGQTGAALPMAANMVAGDSEDVDETPAEQISRRAGLQSLIDGQQALQNSRRSGVLRDGNSFRVLENGNVEVTFRASSSGQTIVRDADDPEDLLPKSPTGARRTSAPTLPSVRLPNGELAVQRETKQLVAFDTQVVAVYEAKNIRLDRNRVPVEIGTYKPIEVKANTGKDGRLVQTESNITTIGKGAQSTTEVLDPRLQRQTDTVKTYRGDFAQTKGPAGFAQRDFKKFENATITGTKDEETRTRVIDFETGRQSVSTNKQSFDGKNTAGKGKADRKDDLDNGDYVINSSSSGKTDQSGKRTDVDVLPTGRILVVNTTERKNANLSQNEKDLVNQGVEFQALDQVDKKNKRGSEKTAKGTRSVVYAVVPQKVKNADGTTRTENRTVQVQENLSFNKSRAIGAFRQEVRDSPDVNPATFDANLAAKKESASSLGASVSTNASLDRGEGIRKFNIGAEGKGGYERKNKNSRAADIPDGTAAAPVQGRADIASTKLLGGLVTASATTSGVSVDAKGNSSKNYTKKDDKAYDPKDPETKAPSAWLGVFSLETLYGSTSLAAGYFAEGTASASIQKGTKGARVKGGELGASFDGSLQVGFYEERRVRYIVKPDINKIPNDTIKFVVQAIDPAVDVTFNAHAFAGAEGKVNASIRYGGDSRTPAGLGASVFAGGRAGLGIDGKLKAGKSLNSGSDLGSLKGEVDFTAGVGAAWKTSAGFSGRKFSIAGEGALTGLIGGRINARGEFDVYKLANVGYAVASSAAQAGYKAAVNVYNADTQARQTISQGGYKTASLAARVQLIRDLLFGRTDASEQDAILEVLRDAQSRGDLAAIVNNVGFGRLSFSLDGARNDQLRALVGR